ncbi:MAG: ORF6N domain-containing protein [Paludibacter sp.]
MELQLIQSKIYELRGLKVMLDFDLSALYVVENRILKQTVKRNVERFPSDFMFKLTKAEWLELIANCDNLPENAEFSPVTPYAFDQELFS